MKKLILTFIILMCSHSYATRVQIDFADNFYIGVSGQNIMYPQEGTATSNAEINEIFSNHGISHCAESYRNHSIIFADYIGTNLVGFTNDLLANANVTRVRNCYSDPNIGGYSYADTLGIMLLTATDGNPTGVNGNIIVTNNASLNALFQTYQVTAMTLSIPNSVYYEIYFEGDITGLKEALDGLDLVINSTWQVWVPMLSNPDFSAVNTLIYPNPFSTTFNIETEQSIKQFNIIDVTGKKVVNTFSKNEFDTQTSQLSSGMYILNLQFENGQTVNHKLVKK
ncbi:T9SS type A sorting domain-containing protein [Flavobacterium silvisoli]|uniref:T9SS type A sorting domain-containing protein n=1 Tax=Flavobacterium silvisoli TaxID=2529433 RepID=A0A4Q9YQU4_9FLAO|nr:T9SS type A sorting domain-containing protein [Flavobacterium silvisoli]TBX65780.1 T9SS type A sorting domain-containing protein [Flavobacterium silvisoli]